MDCHANSSDLQPWYGEIMSGVWIRYMNLKEGETKLTCKAAGLQTVHKIPFWPFHLLRPQGQLQARGAFPPAAFLLPSWLRCGRAAKAGAGQARRHHPHADACHPVSLDLQGVLSIRTAACLHFPLTASDCCLTAWPYANTIQTDSPPQLHHCLLLIQETDSHMKLPHCSTFITGWHILSDSQPHPGESETIRSGVFTV